MAADKAPRRRDRGFRLVDRLISGGRLQPRFPSSEAVRVIAAGEALVAPSITRAGTIALTTRAELRPKASGNLLTSNVDTLTRPPPAP